MFVKMNNLPKRLDDEALNRLVECLRTRGNVTIGSVSDELGLTIASEHYNYTIVNYIIETHIGLAISVANHFRSYDINEMISVALFHLTAAANRFEKLVNNNISAYLHAAIYWGIKSHLKRLSVVRIKTYSTMKDKYMFKIDRITNVSKLDKSQLSSEIREELNQIIKTERDSVIINCLLEGGYKKTEIAQLCGVSNACITQDVDRLETAFRQRWSGLE